MKSIGVVISVLILSVYLAGCGKKQQPPEQSFQEPVSMEALSAMGTEQKAAPEAMPAETKTFETKVSAVQPELSVSPEPKLEPLPPGGPYKPTVNEIQTALKNAGYYSGNVDGKAGPVTKKAVEEFQKANGLNADGKVGPKTWVLLGKHLNAASVKEIVLPVDKKKKR